MADPFVVVPAAARATFWGCGLVKKMGSVSNGGAKAIVECICIDFRVRVERNEGLGFWYKQRRRVYGKIRQRGEESIGMCLSVLFSKWLEREREKLEVRCACVRNYVGIVGSTK